MTLILGMSKPEGIYMSSDYRVTDYPSGRSKDDSSVKFLTAKYPPNETGPTALFGYSGLAILPDKTPTGDWIRETLRGESEVFDASMAHLLARLNRDIARRRFPLQIAVLIIQGEKRFFGGFSNLRRTEPSKTTVTPSFGYRMEELTEPFMFALGSGGFRMSAADHTLLTEQLKVWPRRTQDHMGLLAAVNRRVAAREATVSPFCHVSYVNADARNQPAARIYTDPGEPEVPFSMPFVLFGIDVNHLIQHFHAQSLAVFRGEAAEIKQLDADEINESLKRRS